MRFLFTGSVRNDMDAAFLSMEKNKDGKDS